MLDDFLFWAKCISFFVPNESIEPSSWKVSSSSPTNHLHFEKASFDWFAFFLPMHSHHNGHHLHEKYLHTYLLGTTLTTKWFNYTCMSLLLLYIPWHFWIRGVVLKTWSVGVIWKWVTRLGQGIGNNNMLQLMFMNMTSP